MSSVFISYRRSDSTPYAVSLATALRQAFGSMNVFLDTTGIVIGQRFPDHLKQKLNKAQACIVVIGPDWLRAPDMNGRPRIDDPGDWVHREVRFALKRKIALPVLVHGAQLPAASVLPDGLKELSSIAAATLDDNRMVQDLRRFVADLSERFKLRLVKPNITWPQPDKAAKALSEKELAAWVASRQSTAATGTSAVADDWSRVPWTKDGDAEDGIALLRSYRFRSFEDAIHFIATASRFVTRTEHHPAWSNIWRTVTVRLTTFDIGHKPSVFDLRLAEYLDDLYRGYQSQAPELPGRPSGPSSRQGAERLRKSRAGAVNGHRKVSNPRPPKRPERPLRAS